MESPHTRIMKLAKTLLFHWELYAPSTLLRSNLKPKITLAFRFRVDRKHFEIGAHDNHVISLSEFLFKNKFKMTGFPLNEQYNGCARA